MSHSILEVTEKVRGVISIGRNLLLHAIEIRVSSGTKDTSTLNDALSRRPIGPVRED